MLGHDGRLKGDLTVLNWGDSYWLMGSYYLREWHLRWFEDHMAEGVSLRDLSDHVTGFAIAGSDGKFVNARAVIAGKAVRVSSPDVTDPAAVRYGWADYPVVNLYNSQGLPASPFRTDTWPILSQPR